MVQAILDSYYDALIETIAEETDLLWPHRFSLEGTRAVCFDEIDEDPEDDDGAEEDAREEEEMGLRTAVTVRQVWDS
jgi:hypothetical protein